MHARSTSAALALIGTGYWGKNLARVFHALGALRTICDLDASALAQYGADYAGVHKTTQPEEIWVDASIDMVAIAAPAVHHFHLAKRALEADKDVFVEKPLCLEERQAAELVALAERKGRVLMVGHLLQYHPCVEKLLSMVALGELGQLHYITSNRLNLGKIRREENSLWSFAPHDLSVILSLTGNKLPTRVRCCGESFLTRGVADTTLTMLRFAEGVCAHVYVSWLNPFKEQKLTVVGSQGMAVFDDTKPWGQKLVLYKQYLTWTDGRTPTVNKALGHPADPEEAEPLLNECRHFLDCCRHRGVPRTDGNEGLRVLQVLQMAQSSLDRDGAAIADGAAPPAANYFAHATAVVDAGAEIGSGTKIWHFSHVMKGARIGERCVLGQNVNVDGGVVIGNNVKIQNNVSVYTGAVIEDDVFLGPSCVLTNVINPRSQINRHALYEPTVLRRGCTIGANATIVCGVTIGRYALIGAGAVVTRHVPDYALVVGNPGRQRGWVSRTGQRLGAPDASGAMRCPESGHCYRESEPGVLRCLDLDEEAPLPAELTKGLKSYAAFKAK